MATPRVLTSSPNEKWLPESLPALEDPLGHGSESKVPAKEGGSYLMRSSRRSTQIRPYKRKKRRMAFRGETGLAKHLKGHAKNRNLKCVICKKRFSKKSSLLMHKWSHTNSKAGLGSGAAFGQRAHLPIYTAAHLLKATDYVKSHARNHRKEAMYSCQKCMKIFFLHKNLIKHQKIHLPSVPGRPQAGNPWIDQIGKTKEAERNHSELLLEELTKMRQNFDLLILNHQVQLQVLQGIQRQLNVLLPGNDLINSNVCSLGLLLSQQAAAMSSISVPFFLSSENLLPGSAPHFPS